MTNEEKTLLISYLVDAGEMDPAGDVEAQFLDWYQVREGQVSGETHYKAILDAARVSKRSFEEGRKDGRTALAAPSARRGWDQQETASGLHHFIVHVPPGLPTNSHAAVDAAARGKPEVRSSPSGIGTSW